MIDDIARMDQLEEGALIHLLAESHVIGALHMAEIVEARVGIIRGLERRIVNRPRCAPDSIALGVLASFETV
ncbi:hypothetical protein U1701_00950 [Sphingomonas sp. PB2P19]|uniref:hypothetical protein n=1 Tax=Sphingomonas rhamnosi TaxID=3096156 RepID=UPI002FC87E83